MVDDLLALYDDVRTNVRPAMVLIESETGLGKTKILQEFYARLASERQGVPPYWPERVDLAKTGSVLRDRKRVTPELPFTIAGGAELKYLWWGIQCVDSEDGEPVPRLIDSARQFEVHARQIAEARPDHIDTALTLTQDIISVVGLANPIQLAVNAIDAAKTSASWIQRMRRKSRAKNELAADRRVDAASLSEDERVVRLADAARTASNAGLTVIVVVDDAHSADLSLISFLRQLSQIAEGAVLVVAAVWPSRVAADRDGTTGTVGSLIDTCRHLLADRFRTFELEKLAAGDIAQLIRDAAPYTRQDIIDRFCEVVDGNPLLLRLYLGLDVIQRDIRDGSLDTDPSVFGGLPADAKQVWQRLWAQLPEPSRVALAIASTQGPEFHAGFLEQAARELQHMDAARTGLDEARATFGWVEDASPELSAFTERLRYEVAADNQRQQLDDQQIAVVHRALAAHAVATRRSADWSSTSTETRRTILRSHVIVAKDADAGVSGKDAAESAFELSLVEEDSGDAAAALGAARDAVELGFADQSTPQEAMVIYRTRLGLLERDAGHAEEAFDEINRAEELSREVFGERNETTAILQDEVSDLAVVAPEPDHQSAPATWVGWEVIDHPSLFDRPLAAMADVVVEIAHVEAPMTYRRLYRLVGRSSGSKAVGRLMRDHVDRAVGVASRKRQLSSLSPFRGCSNEDRVLYLAGKSAVKVRNRGDREVDEIPLTELAAVAEAFLEQNRGAEFESIARSVMSAYEIRRLTDNVASTMDRAIAIARRERAKAQKQNELWRDVHRAIAAIPAGHWTSVAELAELADTSTGWVGRHLYGKWELPGLHRVFEADGRPWRWFHWADGQDAGDVIGVLRAEGCLLPDEALGDPTKRLTLADLQACLGGKT